MGGLGNTSASCLTLVRRVTRSVRYAVPGLSGGKVVKTVLVTFRKKTRGIIYLPISSFNFSNLNQR